MSRPALRNNSDHAGAAVYLATDLSLGVGSLSDEVHEATDLVDEALVLAPGYAAARYDLARLLNGFQRIEEMLSQPSQSDVVPAS